MSQSEPLLVVVLGPTGSGKTALSLVLGERFGGEHFFDRQRAVDKQHCKLQGEMQVAPPAP